MSPTTQMRGGYRARQRTANVATYIILISVAILTLLPLVYAFFASFKPLDELLSQGAQLFPEEWTTGSYQEVWELGGFQRYFMNSILVAAGVVAVDFLIASLIGWMLARNLLVYGRALSAVMASVLFIGVGTATLYPRFLIAQALGIDNLIGIILVEVSGMSVIHTFLVRAFVQTLPPELEDAARVDGCRTFGVYRRISLPLMRPILTTTVILAFQAAWNNFQIPYVFTLAQPEMRTLVVGVYALRTGGEVTDPYHLMIAGAMVVIVPIVVVFLLLQRHFMRGMTEGGVKA
ncbi:carbohydrate ABC transporter permease [Ruania alkalisoli]|uniref:Carbohydrate ABC transporter permease n=1 Tax=Ruania alkalisoli TaxID=2779775 RepID=A0A7M1SWW0_9MICO|nr:carbohydrate ABC transporter permease [Ruania alkalisoli]QOR71434.1 carbohydrate ABC transporter permease [Ruania alkalisoli]